MTDPHEHSKEAHDWLRFAQEDLHDATVLLGHEGSTPRNACWNALQSAEKALKSALISEGTRPPKTHDLRRLLGLLRQQWRVATLSSDLSWLSEWAPDLRYPGDLEVATLADARRAVAIAKRVLEDISAAIGPWN
ncbi:MAG: HEPN domain-containing protein [Cyanobacteria bacterium REEB65]|nr:HEPN domain-containing protein [Cyanobacteria bacterium REEB65]